MDSCGIVLRAARRRAVVMGLTVRLPILKAEAHLTLATNFENANQLTA
jgi:hypothetical protein